MKVNPNLQKQFENIKMVFQFILLNIGQLESLTEGGEALQIEMFVGFDTGVPLNTHATISHFIIYCHIIIS